MKKNKKLAIKSNWDKGINLSEKQLDNVKGGASLSCYTYHASNCGQECLTRPTTKDA